MYYLNVKTPLVLFEKAVNSKIYVDKSRMLEKLSARIGTGNQYVCVTRPRRFGKTVNANMVGAYFAKGLNASSVFEPLAIAKTRDYQKHLNRHNVIYIDCSRMPDICQSYETYIRGILDGLKADLIEAYPKLAGKEYSMISRMFMDAEESFIFVLDEWDAVLGKEFMTQNTKAAYLDFLKGLLKDQPYVDLVYMTGVLPIAKHSSGSELNMFEEFSFMNDSEFDRYFGFDEDEVKELCRKAGTLSFDEVKYWYDGYFTSDGKSLFNPRSVNFALTRGKCLNYWTETGPMNEVADCIEHNIDEVREDIVKMVADIPVEVRLKGYSASEFQMNTRDEILSAMVVYGFLSYHDGYLIIPNHELMEKFQDVLDRESMGEVRDIVEMSRDILRATLQKDEDRVAAMIEKVHDREIPFLQYNDENALSCVITLCYLAARDNYFIEREAKSGKGYCDYLLIPKRKNLPAIILELKVGAGSKEAIRQIKARNYVEKVKECKDILLVGIAYNKRKQHECKIESFCAIC